MITLLYGSEKNLIDEYIQKFIINKKINNVSKYNLEDYSILDILNDASYVDLFSEDKVIIMESKEMPDLNESDSTMLEKYLLNPNEKTHLFIVINSTSVSDKNKIISIIKEKHNILQYNKLKPKDAMTYVKTSFYSDGYEITPSALNLFIEYIGNNISLIYTEIEKLKIYKIDDKKINEMDIKVAIKKENETDVFKLVDAVLNNNKEKMLSNYKDLINSGEEEIKLIIMLAGEFRLLFQIKTLLSDGYNEPSITKLLGVNPYRVKLGINRCNRYSDKKLLSCLNSLYKLDYGIKTGNIGKENALLNFFLEM